MEAWCIKDDQRWLVISFPGLKQRKGGVQDQRPQFDGIIHTSEDSCFIRYGYPCMSLAARIACKQGHIPQVPDCEAPNYFPCAFINSLSAWIRGWDWKYLASEDTNWLNMKSMMGKKTVTRHFGCMGIYGAEIEEIEQWCQQNLIAWHLQLFRVAKKGSFMRTQSEAQAIFYWAHQVIPPCFNSSPDLSLFQQPQQGRVREAAFRERWLRHKSFPWNTLCGVPHPPICT